MNPFPSSVSWGAVLVSVGILLQQIGSILAGEAPNWIAIGGAITALVAAISKPATTAQVAATAQAISK